MPRSSVPATIAAISTAPGRSAIAVIRASGPDVRGLLAPLFGGDMLGACHPALRWLQHPETGARLDQVLVTFFPAPHGYTGWTCWR